MKTIRINIRSILLFEFVYRLVFVVFYGRIVNYFLGLLLRSSGYSYLTIKNCKDCLLNPITYPILLLLVFVSVLFAGFETAILSSGFRAASMGQELRVAPMLVRGSKGFLRMFRLRNFPMLFFQGITFYMLQCFILYKLFNTSKHATDLKRILPDIHVIPCILSIVFLVLLGYILIHIFFFYVCYYPCLSY